MSYKVLARKWRPGNFESMLGQSHVITALKNSLEQNRLHHAYLFTGTRGVGKTTVARVFAKALSCEQGMSATPCGTCDSCTAIDAGTYMDLIEVDAASRTGVDDTRDLLDNVQYLPNIGRYKIYLIDEVHMFSNSSFNALLKTLEEPPEHVIFLLATTEPQKLPMTVLSRCLQFNLSRMSEQELATYFEKLLSEENINFDAAAVALLAEAADGSVRDGLSLLDQAIAFGSGEVKPDLVHAMLGTIEAQYIDALLAAVVACEVEEALAAVAALAQHTTDFSRVLDTVAKALHAVSVQQLTGEKPAIDATPELIQLMYQIAIKAKQDLALAPTARVGLEMAVLRMVAFQPTHTSAQTTDENSKKKAPKLTPSASLKKIETVAKKSKTIAEVPSPPVASVVSLSTKTWAALVPDLGLSGLALELARHTVLQKHTDTHVVLALDPRYASTATDNAKAAVQAAINQHTGCTYQLQIQAEKVTDETCAMQEEKQAEVQQQAAEQSILQDPHVADLQRVFGAKIDKDSIKPIAKEQ